MKALLLALVVSAGLAGCFGGGDDPTRTTTGTDGTTGTTTTPPEPEPRDLPLLLDFAFTDCTIAAVVETHAREDVQALLPEGFTAKELTAGGQGSGQAQVTTEIASCAAFRTPTVTVRATHIGFVYADIEAPAVRDVEADLHRYLFRVLAGEDILAQVWPAAGYDTHNGTAEVNLTTAAEEAGLPPTGPPAVARARLGAYALEGSGSQPGAANETFAYAFYTRLAASHLVWTGNVSGTAEVVGPGTAVSPSDDPLTELGGTERRGLVLGLPDGAYTGDLWPYPG